MYRIGAREKSKRKRRLAWLVVALCLAGAGYGGFQKLKTIQPDTTITQSRAVISHAAYGTSVRHFTEPDFTIDLPSSWQAVPRTPSPYNMYTWQNSANGTDGQQIVIYEDSIPPNFAVNRVLIVHGEIDRVVQDGGISENCSTYTNGQVVNGGKIGTPAKWQGVAFLCDQSNMERDVIGTSSLEGVNVVSLKNQSTGVTHKFFFTYTDHSMNPDYTIFTNVVSSFRMQ